MSSDNSDLSKKYSDSTFFFQHWLSDLEERHQQEKAERKKKKKEKREKRQKILQNDGRGKAEVKKIETRADKLRDKARADGMIVDGKLDSLRSFEGTIQRPAERYKQFFTQSVRHKEKRKT